MYTVETKNQKEKPSKVLKSFINRFPVVIHTKIIVSPNYSPKLTLIPQNTHIIMCKNGFVNGFFKQLLFAIIKSYLC